MALSFPRYGATDDYANWIDGLPSSFGSWLGPAPIPLDPYGASSLNPLETTFVPLTALLEPSDFGEAPVAAGAIAPLRLASADKKVPSPNYSDEAIPLPEIVVTPDPEPEPEDAARSVAAHFGLVPGADPFVVPSIAGDDTGSGFSKFGTAFGPYPLDPASPQNDRYGIPEAPSNTAAPVFVPFNEALGPNLFDPFTPAGLSPVDVSPIYSPEIASALPRSTSEGDSSDSQPEVGRFGALAAGVASGLTANFADELYGLDEASGLPVWLVPNPIVRLPVGAGRLMYEWLADKDGPATKSYRQGRDQVRNYMKAAQAQHSGYYLGGQIAGGLATVPFAPELTVVKGATSAAQIADAALAAQAARAALATQTVNAAATGATYGALYGAGEGENWQDRLQGAGVGGITGWVLGAAAPTIVQPAVRRAWGAMRGRFSRMRFPFDNFRDAASRSIGRDRNGTPQDIAGAASEELPRKPDLPHEFSQEVSPIRAGSAQVDPSFSAPNMEVPERQLLIPERRLIVPEGVAAPAIYKGNYPYNT
ncbi:MAG TPA: hypothetical protein VHA77_02450, partial [Xanthobacteraceae bacterium]|nr:hypothetical protein [Xanthobacteraceae bacterium]